jgi:hypothetical protein
MLLRQLEPYPDVDRLSRVRNGLLNGTLDLRASLPSTGSPLCLALAALARRCLDRDPDQRPSANELVIALSAIRSPSSTGKSSVAPAKEDGLLASDTSQSSDSVATKSVSSNYHTALTFDTFVSSILLQYLPDKAIAQVLSNFRREQIDDLPLLFRAVQRGWMTPECLQKLVGDAAPLGLCWKLAETFADAVKTQDMRPLGVDKSNRTTPVAPTAKMDVSAESAPAMMRAASDDKDTRDPPPSSALGDEKDQLEPVQIE